jgi:hypothetical protein
VAYQAVTLASLQTQLGFRTDTSPWWTNEEARLALNEGLRIWNAATGRWVTKFYRPTVPKDPWVALGVTMTQATRVLWNGIPLEKCSQADLDWGFPGWRGATTQTPGAPSRPVYWAPVSLNLFTIYPADFVGLNTLEIAGVHDTPILVNPGDFVDLGQEEHDNLLGYALHVLSFKKGGQFLVTSYAGWINFLKAAAKENDQFAASKFFRRLLGLDAQRVLTPLELPVTNPVDDAASQASQLQGGG